MIKNNKYVNLIYDYELEMNKYQVERLLEYLGNIRPGDVKEVIDKYDLNLDYLEIYDLLSNLYDVLYKNC